MAEETLKGLLSSPSGSGRLLSDGRRLGRAQGFGSGPAALRPSELPERDRAGCFAFGSDTGDPSSFSPMACSTTFRAIVAKS